MATIAITKGYNDPSGFTSGETITPAKLNSAQSPAVAISEIVNADIKSDAAIALSKLATGALPTAITVATANIEDANVTDAKLATGIDASKLTTGTLPIARIADGAVTPAKLSQPLTLATAQATTSGTSIDFTGIPSWVKRITVMLSGVSTNGVSPLLLQLGDSGGIESSGYIATAEYVEDNAAGAAFTAGFGITNASVAATSYHGAATISLAGNNSFIMTGVLNDASTGLLLSAGSKTLSDTLDRVRLTTVNGTDTFDAGSINIMYEG